MEQVLCSLAIIILRDDNNVDGRMSGESAVCIPRVAICIPALIFNNYRNDHTRVEELEFSHPPTDLIT